MEGKRKLNVKKSIIFASMICSLILVGFLGSYAFFISQVGQNKNQEVSVEAGTMALTFSDGNNGFSKELDFGQSAEKTFTIENTGTGDGVVSMSFMNLINTYLEGSMTYTLEEADSLDGEYTKIINNKNVPNNPEASDRVLASGLTISAGTTKYYKLTLSLNYTDFDQTEDLNAKLETQFKITEGILKDPTLSEITLAKLGKKAKEGNPNFAEVATTDETKDGLYAMEDDYGTSYYYRGAVEDNYVRFGTWSNDYPPKYYGKNNIGIYKEFNSLSECENDESYNNDCISITRAGKPMYWRIIRVNGDGSLRVIYDGTSTHANRELSADRLTWLNQKYNINGTDAKFVGYMFGGLNIDIYENENAKSTKRIDLGLEGYEESENAIYNETNSDIKTKLENWYKTNITDKNLDNYVADEIFCNDRTIADASNSWSSWDTSLGYNKNKTAFGGYNRYFSTNGNFSDTPTPELTCKNKNDAFTKIESNKGNGKLKEKVGLITADEANIAGSGKFNSLNQNYYLYKGSSYWTITPENFNGSQAAVFWINNIGFLGNSSILSDGGVAPVLNLGAEFVNFIEGNGSRTNPFKVKNEASGGYV